MFAQSLMFASVLPPLLAALWIFVFGSSEKRIYRVAISAQWLTSLAVCSLATLWWIGGMSPLDAGPFGSEEFHALLRFDGYTAVFLTVTAWVSLIIIAFSKRYLHREEGIRRYYAIVSGFSGGLVLLILSGNMETLYAGWEVIGIASFLLIAFYQRREMAVRHSLLAYSIYRFCDAALLGAGALIHLMSGKHAILANLGDGMPAGVAVFVSLLILVGAMGKSGQFPFTFWVARAMEGPSPSSAIFYGALSVHAGVYLLVRTFGFWHAHWIPTVAIGAVGLLTALMSTVTAKSQTTIKGQVAYASTTQTGLMLVELALGYPSLATLHFACNAFLRCYQLLVAPSTAVVRIRAQRAMGSAQLAERGRWFAWMPSRMRSSLYVFGLREAFMPDTLFQAVWAPLSGVAVRVWQVLKYVHVPVLVVPVLVTAGMYSSEHIASAHIVGRIFVVFAVAAGLAAHFENKSIQRVWNFSAGSAALAGVGICIGATTHLEVADIHKWLFIHLCGIFSAWLFGSAVFAQLKRSGVKMDLGHYNGLVQRHPIHERFALISVLFLTGFPVATTFFTEDVMMRMAVESDPFVAILFAVVFVFVGTSLMRGHCRAFYGAAQR